MRLAALTVAMTLVFSGLTLARDHDDRYKDDHRKYDHDRDKQDNHHGWAGIWHHDRDHDGRNDHWRNERERERDHERWEREHRNDGYYGGPVYNRYPRNYPGGYGYPSGSYGYPGTVYGRGGYGGGYGGGTSGAGYSQGLQDGSYQARKDVGEGKPFNPYPRGSSHSDHGYHSYMGDKNVYRASYDQGYRSGYQSNFGGRGRGWGF